MKLSILRIATRKSPLAYWQADFVKNKLQHLRKELRVEVVGMLTTADKMFNVPLSQIGGKGLYVKELENALIEHSADIAVHSVKDLPPNFPANLTLAVVCKRDDPRDVLISRHGKYLNDLPKNAVVGTSSLRRQSQLLAIRPDLIVKNLRGNVGTRLAKLDAKEFDAIILAAAGLKRLKLSDRISSYISILDILPAAGQGAIGIECRENDEQVLKILSDLNDLDSQRCIEAERAMTKHLGGNCQAPIAAYANIIDGKLVLQGRVAAVDGSKMISVKEQGSVDQPQKLGQLTAKKLLEQGAEEILEKISMHYSDLSSSSLREKDEKF